MTPENDTPDDTSDDNQEGELLGTEVWVQEMLVQQPRRASVRSDVHRQTAALCAIDTLDDMGSLPMPRSEIERVLFLVDCLRPAVQAEALHGLILKQNSGPQQSDWLWDLDRAVGMGVLDIKYYDNIQGGYAYYLSEPFFGLIRKALDVAPELSDFASLLRGFIALYGSRAPEEQLALLEHDRTYSVPDDTLIDYGLWKKGNPSAEKARYLVSNLGGDASTPDLSQMYVRSLLGGAKEAMSQEEAR